MASQEITLLISRALSPVRSESTWNEETIYCQVIPNLECV